MEIRETVNEFRAKSGPFDRYTSFDYCYRYFLTTENPAQDMEKSCLELGFYLASWGMLRGSTILLQKSAKYFQETVEYISTVERTAWNIDVDQFGSDQCLEQILQIYVRIASLLKGSDTLTTKVMLGVFGFIPAFDQYVKKTFKVRGVTVNAIRTIKSFYDSNKAVIDALSNETFVKDFSTGEDTNIHYPKAKIIDMYGFIAGQKK